MFNIIWFIRVNFGNKAWLKRKAVPLTLTRCNSHQFQIASQNNIRIKKVHSLNCSEKMLLLNWKENSNLKSISTKSHYNDISIFELNDTILFSEFLFINTINLLIALYFPYFMKYLKHNST